MTHQSPLRTETGQWKEADTIDFRFRRARFQRLIKGTLLRIETVDVVFLWHKAILLPDVTAWLHAEENLWTTQLYRGGQVNPSPLSYGLWQSHLTGKPKTDTHMDNYANIL